MKVGRREGECNSQSHKDPALLPRKVTPAATALFLSVAIEKGFGGRNATRGGGAATVAAEQVAFTVNSSTRNLPKGRKERREGRVNGKP